MRIRAAINSTIYSPLVWQTSANGGISDLPNIKCLKDDDDARLDFESYVSDVLLDEGKAQVDASDQRATIYVVLEKGWNTREGSVALDNQLADSRYELQLKQASHPPVPTFSGLPSSLGKRPFSTLDEQATTRNGTKRARHSEIPEPQEGPVLVSRNEPEAPAESIELVEGTQYSGSAGTQVSQPAPKDESPELQRLLQNVPPATVDELQVLPEQPLGFGSNKKAKKDSRLTSSTLQPNGIAPESTQRLQTRAPEPITPISESSKRRQISSSLQPRSSEDKSKPLAQNSSAAATKFKRYDVYDYPVSEIDDSQMSPNSKQAQLNQRASNDRLSHIENLKSPQENKTTDHELSVSQAIETLDDDSVFEDDRPLEESLKAAANPPSRQETSSSGGAIETSIYEDSEEEDDETSSDTTSSGETDEDSESGDEQEDDDKENRLLARRVVEEGVRMTDTVKAKPIAGSGVRPSTNGIDVKSVNSDNVNEEYQTTNASKPTKKIRHSRETPSLDSPGEQLSQNLLDSTKKPTSMKFLDKKLAEERKMRSATPGKKVKQVMTETSSKKVTPKTPNSAPSKATTSIESSAGKANKEHKLNSASAPSSVVVHRAQGMDPPSTSQKLSLPRWGSAEDLVTTSKKAERLASAKNHEDSRKSPSVGIGLSAEELKMLESRKNMTPEQYEAEKKRKREESKKLADQQRKQEAAAKKKKRASLGKESSMEKNSDDAKPTTKTPNARKSLSAEEEDEDEDDSPQQSTTSTRKPVVVKREPSAPASSKASVADSMPPPKTPGKVTAAKKSPSVQSASMSSKSKTLKTPTTVSKKGAPTASTILKKAAPTVASTESSSNTKSKPTPSSSSAKPLSKPIATTKPPAPAKPASTPTSRYNHTLKELHDHIRLADKDSTTVVPRATFVKPDARKAAFSIDSDDDEDSSNDSDDEPEEVKPRKPVVQKQPQPRKRVDLDDDEDDTSSSE